VLAFDKNLLENLILLVKLKNRKEKKNKKENFHQDTVPFFSKTHMLGEAQEDQCFCIVKKTKVIFL